MYTYYIYLAHNASVFCIKNARFIKYASFSILQNRTVINDSMNERMKSMEENVEKVRRRKTMFYAVVGLQFRKMYIGIMYLQIYIFSDT
jgi:hypothetical protein